MIHKIRYIEKEGTRLGAQVAFGQNVTELNCQVKDGDITIQVGNSLRYTATVSKTVDTPEGFELLKITTYTYNIINELNEEETTYEVESIMDFTGANYVDYLVRHLISVNRPKIERIRKNGTVKITMDPEMAAKFAEEKARFKALKSVKN